MRSTIKLLALLAALTGLALLAAAPASPASSKTVTLEVSGMHCAVCPITVRKALEAVPGVEKATVTLTPPQAVVVYDPAKVTPARLTQATADAGYPSTVEGK